MAHRANRPDPPELLLLPRYLASDLRLLGTPVTAVKTLLVLEHLRGPLARDVTCEVPLLAHWLNVTVSDVRAGLDALPDLVAAYRPDDTRPWSPFRVVEPEDVTWTTGRGALAAVRVSADWRSLCAGAPDAQIPFSELAGLQTRTGLLLRLRAAGLLAGRGTKPPRPYMVYVEDMEHYTGHGGTGSPATIYRQYVERGLADVERHCPSVVIGADTVHAPGPQERLRGMRLSVRKSVVRRARRATEAA